MMARQGDGGAWEELHRRFDSQLRHVGAQFRLGPDEVADAAQNTWVALIRDIARIRRPASVRWWLCNTMRHECLKVVAARKREEMVGDWSDWPLEDSCARSDSPVLRRDRDRALWHFVDLLPPRQRDVIRALAADPSGSYQGAARALSIAVGTVGPTRMRALSRLRELVADAGLGFHDLCLDD